MDIDPLCGQQWLDQHRQDHTQAEIDALGIEPSFNGKVQGCIQSGDKKARGIVKQIIEVNR